jgi:hypothetical protein
MPCANERTALFRLRSIYLEFVEEAEFDHTFKVFRGFLLLIVSYIYLSYFFKSFYISKFDELLSV